MPAAEMSSVVVVSTARAQRMQRRTWTEAEGGSMVKAAVVDEVDDEESESQAEDEEEEADDTEPKEAELCPAGMMRERRGREAWLVNSGMWTILYFGRARSGKRW